MRYIYAAIFESCEEGGYSVSFPDLPGCFTEGDDLLEAMEMAEEAACGWLSGEIDAGREIPKPTEREELKETEGSFINMISPDLDAYRRKKGDRAVKKTLTIPAWLNEAAISADINFSQVLQDALKEKLGVA